MLSLIRCKARKKLYLETVESALCSSSIFWWWSVLLVARPYGNELCDVLLAFPVVELWNRASSRFRDVFPFGISQDRCVEELDVMEKALPELYRVVSG